MKGRVTFWNSSTNCGFIEVDNEDLFVHLKDKNFVIHENQEIEFSIQEKKEGIFIYNLKQVVY